MKKVIIIGAGIAGISAAIKLVKSGFDVTVFETKNSPGGRIYSFRDNITDEYIDNGQHLLSGAYSSFFKILEELGTSEFCKKQDSLKVFFAEPNQELKLLDTSVLPGIPGLILGFIKFNGLSTASKWLLIKFFIKLKLSRIDNSDSNCKDFLQANRQNDELINKFWEPLILATLNTSPGKAPAKLLVNVLREAFFADPELSRLILPVTDLSNLINPFSDWMKSRDSKLYTNTRIEKIIISNGRATGIVSKDGVQFQANYIISSVQPHVLYNIIPEQVKSDFGYLSQFKFTSITNLYYWTDKYIESPDFSALLGTDSQWMFNRERFVHRDRAIIRKYPGLINITISDSKNIEMNPERLAVHCWNELLSCLPQFKKCNILHSRVINDRFATVELTTETEKIRPDCITTIEGLYLSGDWTNTGLPATIEGASRSGEHVAQAIINQK